MMLQAGPGVASRLGRAVLPASCAPCGSPGFWHHVRPAHSLGLAPTQPAVAPAARVAPVCHARRRDEPGSWRARREKNRVELNINGQEYSLSNTNLAVMAVLGLALAAIVGPLIVGIIVATVAIGGALSLGAMAMSFLWLPFAALFGFVAFSLFLPFGAFATFGLGLMFPKLMSMAFVTTCAMLWEFTWRSWASMWMWVWGGGLWSKAVWWAPWTWGLGPWTPAGVLAGAGGGGGMTPWAVMVAPAPYWKALGTVTVALAIAGAGMALGWYVVSNMLPARSSASGNTSMPTASTSQKPGYDDGPVVMAESKSLDEEEEEIRRRARELREFDQMIAEREEQKRVDEWRRRTRGG